MKSVAKLLYLRKGRSGFCRNFEERRKASAGNSTFSCKICRSFGWGGLLSIRLVFFRDRNMEMVAQGKHIFNIVFIKNISCVESDLCLGRNTRHFLSADTTFSIERVRRINCSFKNNIPLRSICKQMQVHRPPIRICENDVLRSGICFCPFLESLLM